VLWLLANVQLRAGRWEAAERHLEESVALHHDSGYALETTSALLSLARLAAHRGDEKLVAEKCAAARSVATAHDVNTALLADQEATVEVLLDLGSERYREAAARPTPDIRRGDGWIEPGVRTGVPNGIEALVGAGRLEEAEELLMRWEELGRRLDRPRALATGARCRGLLHAARGEHEAALASLERALVEHERLPVPFERGRTLLALGTQRRRLRRRAEAREALEQALAIFEELGAVPWAERARRELSRIPGRRVADADELTDAERRIAELVAEGRSNKEVAAALFVSVKTVEVTLTRVYRKLGVHSRAELAHGFTTATKD
jgi:DNA-binding CsgD family transcriptional regulator